MGDPGKEQLDSLGEAILAALPADGHTRGNIRLRNQLGVAPDRYADAATVLKDLGLVVAGRGAAGAWLSPWKVNSSERVSTGSPLSSPAKQRVPGHRKQPFPRQKAPGRDRDDAEWQSTPIPHPPSLAQQELESRLWAAANSLRGPVDAADFKAYIFPLLFFKRICDARYEEHEQAASDYHDLLDDEIEADYYRFVVPESCHWDDPPRLAENIGVGLQRMLQRIEQVDSETLAGSDGLKRAPLKPDDQPGTEERSTMPETTTTQSRRPSFARVLQSSGCGNAAVLTCSHCGPKWPRPSPPSGDAVFARQCKTVFGAVPVKGLDRALWAKGGERAGVTILAGPAALPVEPHQEALPLRRAR